MKIFTYWLSVAVLLSCAFGASIRRSRITEGQIAYLEKYGYLRRNEMAALSSRTQTSSDSDILTRALRSFQRSANIPLTGVMDQATIRMMNTPRCGVLDSEERSDYQLFGTKWNTTNLSYYIQNASPDLPLATQERVFEDAFKMWASVSPLRFTRRRQSHPKSHLNIAFARRNHGDGPDNSFDGPGPTLAHAFFPPNGAIHFDDDELWTLDRPTEGRRGPDLLQVAAHEIGHALGLSHTDVEGAIMFRYYNDRMSNVRLHSDDISGIQALYGAPPRGNPGSGPARSPTSSTTYNCDSRNPCKPEITRGVQFYFPHDIPSKFVQCSGHGQCYEMPCAPGTVWNPVVYNCT